MKEEGPAGVARSGTIRGGSADQGRPGRGRTPPTEQKGSLCDVPGGTCNANA